MVALNELKPVQLARKGKSHRIYCVPSLLYTTYVHTTRQPQPRSSQLFRECAGILEGMKQPAEAAAMYELGGQDHRAAAIYVAGKDLDKAATVMPRVTQPKLLGQYAKACEITGR